MTKMVSGLTAALIAGIPTILGIIATIVAWKLNPQRRIYDQLDAVYDNIDTLEKTRDDALANNEADRLSVATSGLILLRKKKVELRSRLK